VSERFFEAMAAGDEEAVRELVAWRPELAAERDAEGLSAVRTAAYRGADGIVAVLLEANPALDVFDAAAVGRTRGLAELVDAEPGLVRTWSADGFTPLHLAAFFGHGDAAKLLIECGSDVNAVARNPELQVTPLHSAAAGGHTEIVKVLLEHGADVNARQGGGFTPLHSAAQNDDRESVEALLEAGADPSLESDEGKTPADLAGVETRDLVALSN